MADAYKRARQQTSAHPDLSDVHETLSLAEVVLVASDQNRCLNLLDLPNAQPDVPIFLRWVFLPSEPARSGFVADSMRFLPADHSPTA